jgi:hypothetical protein
VIVVVPNARPETMPVELPTVAAAVLLLLHVPPKMVLLNAADEPTHTFAGPVITVGGGTTVITVDVAQPVANV